MGSKPESERGTRPGGAPAGAGGAGADRDEALLNRALHNLRTRPVSTLPWERTENVILTGKKERIMQATTKIFTRKLAMVGAFSVAMLLIFFTVPFSQTNPIGASVVFELDEAPLECGEIDLRDITGDPMLGITDCQVRVNQQLDGPFELELIVFTENGIVPEELVTLVKEEYPELADARVTITPIVERTSGTMFDHLTGELQLEIDCEGKTAEEIEAEIETLLAEQGAEGADVQVITDEVGGEQRVEIKVQVEQEAEEPVE